MWVFFEVPSNPRDFPAPLASTRHQADGHWHGKPALYLWDLRALRAGLEELGLDWDQPAYTPAAAPVDTPLRVESIWESSARNDIAHGRFPARIRPLPLLIKSVNAPS
jgi:hypothetical protein